MEKAFSPRDVLSLNSQILLVGQCRVTPAGASRVTESMTARELSLQAAAAVNVKTAGFWGVTSCSLIYWY